MKDTTSNSIRLLQPVPRKLKTPSSWSYYLTLLTMTITSSSAGQLHLWCSPLRPAWTSSITWSSCRHRITKMGTSNMIDPQRACTILVLLALLDLIQLQWNWIVKFALNAITYCKTLSINERSSHFKNHFFIQSSYYIFYHKNSAFNFHAAVNCSSL